MVDREKVIKALEVCSSISYGEECPKECPYRGQDMYCIGSVGLMLDALDLLKEHGWISVNDRLPNCNGCYLVWRPHFYPDKGMPSICYFDGQNTWHDSYGVDFTRILAPDDVSHWMPLPEQPCKAVKWE